VGNQFDAFANNIRDGWACLAVRAADKLGNEQVSRVLRVCIDHNSDGVECPHQPLTAIVGGTPITVTTASPHGLGTGEEIVISQVFTPAKANGRWRVSPIDATRFSLVGSSSDPAGSTGSSGLYLRAAVLPDCTGTQTAIQPVTVTSANACTPWGSYSANEIRRIN
jgi:hypothetical protein